MQVDGKRIAAGNGSANFKKAIRWLTLAGEQGLAQAWYALSRIYVKPEFSQRNVGDAQKYLERAAEMGYREAQLECGLSAWRARRENENNDVRAVYWLQKAAAQGCADAAAALRKIAPRPDTPAYTETGRLSANAASLAESHPLLAARLELAALFRLTRAEALLLDVQAADRGHPLQLWAQQAPPCARRDGSRAAGARPDRARVRQHRLRAHRAGRKLPPAPVPAAYVARRRGAGRRTGKGGLLHCRVSDIASDVLLNLQKPLMLRKRREAAGLAPAGRQISISPSNTVTAGPLR
jgi:hypothetical protein